MKKRVLCTVLLLIIVSGVALSMGHDELINQIKSALDAEDYYQAKSFVNELSKAIDNHIITISTPDDPEEFSKLLVETKSPLQFNLSDNDELLVSFGSTTFYVLGPSDSVIDKHSTSKANVELRLLTADKKNIISNKFISVDGETKKITYSSLNPSVATIDDSGRISILSEGAAVIRVSIDDSFGDIPLKVIQLPINRTSTKDDIILTLGFPDNITEQYISWPSSKTIDGVFYSTNIYGVNVVHWIYDKYPGMILSVGSISPKIEIPSWNRFNISK